MDFNLDKNKGKIAISQNAARQLGLKVGDKIDVYFISDDLRVRRMKIVAIFNSHFDQYDNLFVYGPMSLVQKMGNIGTDQARLSKSSRMISIKSTAIRISCNSISTRRRPVVSSSDCIAPTMSFSKAQAISIGSAFST